MGASVNVEMVTLAHRSETEIHIQEGVSWETTCWGCGQRVQLPNFAPTFRCGWCGAITTEKSETQPISPFTSRCSKLQHQLVVSVVVLAIVSIVCAGIWATFPVLFPTATTGYYVHSTITAILSFNTLLNFCMSAFTLAGPSTEHGVVGRQSLEGYKFCVYCERPKPPNAHHCRSCHSCVVDMDHHCPFIGNCVGANNLRYFLLFLAFATVSGFYLFGMTLSAGSKVWPNLVTRFRRDNMPRLYMAVPLTDMLLSMIVDFDQVTAIRAFVLFYLFVSGVGLAVGVGVLLYHQVKLIYSGQTYIESLRSGGGEERERDKSWAHLRRVFGRRHPCLWLLPSISSKSFAPSQKVH